MLVFLFIRLNLFIFSILKNFNFKNIGFLRAQNYYFFDVMDKNKAEIFGKPYVCKG